LIIHLFRTSVNCNGLTLVEGEISTTEIGLFCWE